MKKKNGLSDFFSFSHELPLMNHEGLARRPEEESQLSINDKLYGPLYGNYMFKIHNANRRDHPVSDVSADIFLCAGDVGATLSALPDF